jgi:hypothetical protein
MADKDVTESGEPFAATPGNVAVLRSEAADLLRAALVEPWRGEAYRKRAAWLDETADRMERTINRP